jgi:hypothetical protein
VITPADYLGIVLDANRLAILGRAVVGPVDVGSMAAALDLTRKDVLKIVGRLQQAGLLDDERRLDRARLAELGAALPRMEPAGAGVLDGSWSSEEAEVLRRFFTGSRLREIPGQRSKRRIVLERLVQEFEPGVRYPERQVNMILQLVHPDYAALRRYLVDEGLMTRAEGVYWRTGGRYDPAGS